MSDLRVLKCHCGAVEINVKFDNGLENIRKGAIMAAVPISHLEIIKGKENLSLYQWNTKVAEHYFCKTCGIYTHHKRRSNPLQYGINIACIENINPFDYGDIPIGNGNLNAPLPQR